MPFFPIDFEQRPDSILDWRFYGPFYWQAEVLDNLLAQQKAGTLSHDKLFQCLEQARQKAQTQAPSGLLECIRQAQLAAQATAVQQAVQQVVQVQHIMTTAFAVSAVLTQPIPQPVIQQFSQPTETQSIPQSIPQSVKDPRIAREKLRKREQRKRKRSSVSKTTQTAEHGETVSQPHQGIIAYEATSYKALGHGTARETTWPTAGSLGHAKQGDREVLAAMGLLHGWMFRDSG